MQRNEIKPLYTIKQYWDCHLKNKIRSIRVIRGQKNIFCAFCDFRVTSILHFSLFTSRSDH